MESKRQKNIVRAVLLMAILEPAMTIPQIYEIWVKHLTSGVSLTTWTFFAVAAFTWLIYGLSIKNFPLILSGSLWVMFEGTVVAGLIIYR